MAGLRSLSRCLPAPPLTHFAQSHQLMRKLHIRPCARLPLAIFAIALSLGGCASPALDALPLVLPPAQWQVQVQLPHNGQVADLSQWWQQFNDPLLVQVIDAAQVASPTLAAAQSRIEQARATQVAAGAAVAPMLEATASATRGHFELATPLANRGAVGFNAAWELDIFGAGRAAQTAAQARFEGAQAGWHDARVLVAAEAGLTYLNVRACEAQLAQTLLDVSSRAETARLTELAAQAGFQAPAEADLASASAAQGRANLVQQRTLCDQAVKGLVALTGLVEPALRAQLQAGTAQLPVPPEFTVPQVPAEALAQRPDVAIAEREVLAASADERQAQRLRWPRIALLGNLTATRVALAGVDTSGTVWSVGPVSVTLPLWDGGVRQANTVAAQARHTAALSAYAANLRTAVREAEDALLAVQSTAQRSTDARTASERFARYYLATQARQQSGLASLFELEDARRSALQAQSALIDLQRERTAAWVALYRAVGGGWNATALFDTTLTVTTQPQ
jgi:outer membrane protein, multidrug efflux system